MLPLLPHATLETSLYTAVLVGILVVWFFQETFGWGFVGLVVPGYLASVLAVQPLSGAVMIVEAIATWLVYTRISDTVPRWWPWTPLFGRDRFFGILVISVLVRLFMEATLLPALAQRLAWLPPQQLHSFGLVIVPLLANGIWRSGLEAGLVRIGTPVLLTWAILRFVLLGNTNLSLAEFELTYEDLALNFVGSPRAYLLVLVGAWLGSWSNLRWGWEYGGILVPGLLTLCWLMPERLAATLAEATVLALIVGAVLHHPVLRNVNLTGGRPLVLSFLVAWTGRFVLGWLLGSRLLGVHVHDLFGFGYLLPTLLAMRMVKHGTPLMALIPTALTSLAGFLCASALGYALYLILPPAGRESARAEPILSDNALRRLELAAYADEGDAPERPESLLDAPSEEILSGGGGFGALWVRPGGRPLILVTRAGPLGAAGAAVALAQTLDVRGLLLCAPEGPACAGASDALELRMPVLRLEPGAAATLAFQGTIPPGLDLSRLGSLVQELDVVPGDRLVLSLPDPVRLRVAANAAPSALSTLREALQPLAASSSGQESPGSPRNLPSLSWLDHEVLAPLFRWTARGTEAQDALRVASAAAREVGLRVGVEGDRALISGSEWRMLLDRGASGPLIAVQRAEDDPGAPGLGAALGAALGARAVIVDDPPSAPVDQPAVQRAAQVALLAALRQDPRGAVWTVRGIRDLFDPGAEVVLTAGHPALRPEEESPGLSAIGAQLGDLGYPSRWTDGAGRRLSFLDPGNTARAAAAAAGGESGTIWAGALLLARAAPLDETHPWWGALSQLPRRDLAVGDLIAAVERAGAPPAPTAGAWADLAQLAWRWVDTGRPEHLGALTRAARVLGVTLTLDCDALLGCRWVGLEAPEGADDEGLLIPVGAAFHAPASPAGDPPAAWRVALGAEVLPVRGLRAPR